MTKADKIAELIINNKRLLQYRILKINKDLAIQNDILQDLYLKLYNCETFDPFGSNAKSYISNAIQSILIDKIRKKKLSCVNIDDINHSYSLGVESYNNIDYEKINNEIKNFLTTFEYNIIKMVETGFKMKEISEELNCGESHIKQSLFKMRKKIKEHGILESYL